MQSQNVFESTAGSAVFLDVEQDIRLTAEKGLVGTTGDLDGNEPTYSGNLSNLLGNIKTTWLSECRGYVDTYLFNRSRASHTVAKAPNPSFCIMRYRGALDLSL